MKKRQNAISYWIMVMPALVWLVLVNIVPVSYTHLSDIQSIMKKAMVERMKAHYGVSWFPETGASFPLRVFLFKDVVTIGIDTSGDSLHKRGYRTLTSKAPITETLAAALLYLTPWNKDRILVDPVSYTHLDVYKRQQYARGQCQCSKGTGNRRFDAFFPRHFRRY